MGVVPEAMAIAGSPAGASVIYLLAKLSGTLVSPNTTASLFLDKPLGLLVVVIGLVYWLVFPRKECSPSEKSRRLGVAAGIGLIGLGLLAFGCFQLRLPPLPEDRLVITIAQFTPISPAASEEAATISHRIEQALMEKQREGAPLQVKRVTTVVKGVDEETRKEQAKSLGMSREGRAHIVAWGEVREDEGELWLKPHLTVSTELPGGPLGEPIIEEYVSIEPGHLEFKERLSKDIADLVIFLHGLAYYKMQNWDKAIEILELSKSREAYFYIGLSRTRLSTRVEKREGIKLAKEAISAHNNALEAYTEAEFPQEWAMNQNALGLALFKTAYLLGGEEGKDYLQKAVDAFKGALRVYSQSQFPQQWAGAQTNLGMAISSLGIAIRGKEGEQFLQEGIEAHRAALIIYTKSRSPQRWAGVQTNLGLALSLFGALREKVGTVQEGIEAHNAALEVYTQREFPQQWSKVHYNLGLALAFLAEMSEDHNDALAYIMRAIDHFEKTLSVLTPPSVDYDIATRALNMAITLKERLEAGRP